MNYKKDQNKMKLNKRTFRLNSKSLFLTYPDTEELNMTNCEIMDELYKRLKSIEWMAIANENGDEDHPYPHIHILIKMNEKCDISNVNALDLKNVHGNYQSVGKFTNVYRYIIKEQNWDIYSKSLTESQKGYIKRNMAYKICSKKEVMRDDFFFKEVVDVLCFKKESFDYGDIIKKVSSNKDLTEIDCIKLIQYLRNEKLFHKIKDLVKLGRQVRNTKPMYIHRNFLLGMYFWLSRTNKYNKPLTLFLRGDSNIGKTSLLEHLFGDEACFIQHKDGLKKIYKEDLHNIIVWDDIRSQLKTERTDIIQFIDSEQNYQADVKCDMKIIDKEKKRILTSNQEVQEIFPSNDKAIKKRMTKINIEKRRKDISLVSYTNTLGEGIYVNYRDCEFDNYDMIINIKEEIVLFGQDEYKEKINGGENYIMTNYGMMLEAIKDIRYLEDLIVGDRKNKHAIKFKIVQDVLDEQIKKKSYIISNESMKSILSKHLKRIICICRNINDMKDKVDYDLECFVCTIGKKYTNKSWIDYVRELLGY